MRPSDRISNRISGRRSAAAMAAEAPLASRVTFGVPSQAAWYDPVIIGPSTPGELAVSAPCLRRVVAVLERLEPDDYIRYLLQYYRAGLERFGDAWRYADILTALLAVAEIVRPEHYLEIGVRRGRSMAMVAAACPDCSMVGFDLWTPDYAGMPNPGPEFVRTEMAKVGHRGALELVSGDSHETVPRFLSEHPEMFFDLVTVDGDHSRKGAERDLRDVLPRVKVGGVIVLDDICHPLHRYLASVWKKVVVSDPRFGAWQFTELGYGVALAIRKSR